MGLIKGRWLMLEIKVPLEVASSPRYCEIIIRCKTASDGARTKFIFQPSTFFEESWLMGYRGVVTFTELDFGPRVPLTTAAIA